jgi:AbrB family looped-hinge helix DNA binding protein
MRTWRRAVARSTLSKKYQTTVPREVREKLGIGPGDVLLWEVVGGLARVRPATRAFLARRGSIRVGSGSVVEEVRKARRQRGRERQSGPRRSGAWKGQVWMAEDFDAPFPAGMAAGFGVDEKKDEEG